MQGCIAHSGEATNLVVIERFDGRGNKKLVQELRFFVHHL
jgi:hypothetical protein